MNIGCEGVGIYWCLIEMLYEEGGSLPLKDIEIYAKILNTTAEKISQTLTDFNLFRKNKTHFYSIALTKRLKHINAKREEARTSGKLGGLANAKRTLSERVAIKERKVKESKEDKVNKDKDIPPKIEDVIIYCKERNKGVNPEKWYNHYQAKGWMIGKSSMKDWKAAVRTWEEDKTKSKGGMDDVIKNLISK